VNFVHAIARTNEKSRFAVQMELRPLGRVIGRIGIIKVAGHAEIQNRRPPYNDQDLSAR